MTPRVGTWDYAKWAAQGDNNASPIMGAAAWVHDKTKQLDPLFWILGKKKYQKVQDLIGKDHTIWINKKLEPVSRFHRQNLDPIAGVSSNDSIPKYGEKKSGDILALVAGAYAGAGALGGSAGGAGGSGGSWMNWMPTSMPQQQRQQQPQPAWMGYGPRGMKTPYGLLGY
jgi:hypothetical protein